MNKLKKFLLSVLVLQMFFAYTPAFAANDVPDYSQGGKNPISSQIEDFLCAPTDASKTGEIVSELTGNTKDNAAQNPAGSDLYNCINKLYRFVLIFGSVMAVFFTVVAGYVYMSAEGNSESVEKAKSIFTSSITALVILFGAYIILRALNPDLISFKTFQPYEITYTAINEDEGTGGGNKTIIGTAGKCTGCVDYTDSKYNLTGNGSQHKGKNTFLAETLATKLGIAKQKYPNLQINEAYPPTVDHSSSCHFNGNCADVGTTAARNTTELENLCKAIKEAGLKILNEYPGITTSSCGTGKATSKSTGGHLHVYQ